MNIILILLPCLHYEYPYNERNVIYNMLREACTSGRNHRPMTRVVDACSTISKRHIGEESVVESYVYQVELKYGSKFLIYLQIGRFNLSGFPWSSLVGIASVLWILVEDR